MYNICTVKERFLATSIGCISTLLWLFRHVSVSCTLRFPRCKWKASQQLLEKNKPMAESMSLPPFPCCHVLLFICMMSNSFLSGFSIFFIVLNPSLINPSLIKSKKSEVKSLLSNVMFWFEMYWYLVSWVFVHCLRKMRKKSCVLATMWEFARYCRWRT